MARCNMRTCLAVALAVMFGATCNASPHRGSPRGDHQPGRSLLRGPPCPCPDAESPCVKGQRPSLADMASMHHHDGMAPECGPAFANGTCPDGFHACMKHGPGFRVVFVPLDADFDDVADMKQPSLVGKVMRAVEQALNGTRVMFSEFMAVRVQRDIATNKAVLLIMVSSEQTGEVAAALSEGFCLDAENTGGTRDAVQICQSAATFASSTEVFPMLEAEATPQAFGSQGGTGEDDNGHKHAKMIIVVVVVALVVVAAAFAVRRWRKTRSARVAATTRTYELKATPCAGQSKLELMCGVPEAAPAYDNAVRVEAFSNPVYGKSP